MIFEKRLKVLDRRLREYASKDMLGWHVIGLQFVIAALFTTGFMQAWTAAIHIPLALLYGYFTGKGDAYEETIKLLKYREYKRRIGECYKKH